MFVFHIIRMAVVHGAFYSLSAVSKCNISFVMDYFVILFKLCLCTYTNARLEKAISWRRHLCAFWKLSAATNSQLLTVKVNLWYNASVPVSPKSYRQRFMRQQRAGLGYIVGYSDFASGVRKSPIKDCNTI